MNAAHLPSLDFTLVPILGGGNNRGYRLTTGDGRDYFLKWYFRHPDDPRDRLGTEFAFTQFCRRCGVDEVPEPLARDAAAGLALYEFVEGRRLAADEVDDAAVTAAVAFFERINEHRREAEAARLPAASEACFSLNEHLERIAGRVDRLAVAAAAEDVDAAFGDFVLHRLRPTWNAVREVVVEGSRSDHAVPDGSLPQIERRLSPSDFGFHNALETPDGRLRFLDLEYAGWDDPAKTFCDFFCQVQVPVPKRYWSTALAGLAGTAAARAERLYPAYVVKWCCIVLNVFLPAGSARRTFGATDAASPERRAAQLRLATDMLDSLSLSR